MIHQEQRLVSEVLSVLFSFPARKMIFQIKKKIPNKFKNKQKLLITITFSCILYGNVARTLYTYCVIFNLREVHFIFYNSLFYRLTYNMKLVQLD